MDIETYTKNVEKIIYSLKQQVDLIIYENENLIIRLNTAQMEQGIGSDGNELKNANGRMYTGRYKLSTQLLDPTKIAGDLYNFNKTGSMFQNMFVEIKKDGFEIGSTGTGSRSKKGFFDGYNGKLFGLNEKDQEKVNKLIHEKILEWINTIL